MDPTIKRKRHVPELSRGAWIGIGTAAVVLAFVMLGMSLWETFGGAAKMRVIRVPGFHELKLSQSGLYVGVYQHTGQGPIPVNELSRLDVRIMSKDQYEEVPVLMNTAGQSVSRMGFRGMPVFSFVAPHAGDYTLSAVYLEGMTGPNVSLLVFHQETIDVKQTLIVGALFFVFFLVLGIWVLAKSEKWSHAHDLPPA
jgi:hypothetical protein